LSERDTVIEVGPGRGVLTWRLVECAERVIAIELDAHLCDELPARLGFPPNLKCVAADARESDLASLASADDLEAVPYKVVGNLPYYAANPIIRRTLESPSPPSLAVFMVQREVAESMTASQGDMGLLSVATQFYAQARMVCSVPPSAFRPPPKVRSAVVRLEILRQPAVDVPDRDSFFRVVRAGFSAPRKQLRNSLSHGLGVDVPLGAEVLEAAGVDGRRRPSTLSLEEWATICRVWQGMGREAAAGAN
jgi:16S rRNA (adenine1518-N6/adenine1519-N6)-dimethyltransferase